MFGVIGRSARRDAPDLTVICIRLAKVRVPMGEMTRPSATSSLGSQFNAFLFASIDEAASEMPLSVVSALARLDLDPWQEAAELSQLPRESAVQRFAAGLSKLPGDDLAHSDAQTIAQRLIALLPGHADRRIGSSRPGDGSGTSPQIDPNVVLMLFALMLVIAMAISGLSRLSASASANVAPASAPASGPAWPMA